MGHTDPGITRRALRIILNSSQLMLADVHPHTPITVVRTEYVVMSFPSAPLSGNKLSLLSSMVVCVYRSALLARHWI
jgi:hypothetical protein